MLLRPVVSIISSIQEGKSKRISNSKTNLGYSVSSKSARSIWGDPALKNKGCGQESQNKKQKKGNVAKVVEHLPSMCKSVGSSHALQYECQH